MQYRLPLTITIVAVCLAGASSLALAGSPGPDHLKCYKLKVQDSDTSDHAFEELTLTTFGGVEEEGCRLLPLNKPKPKEICIPAVKEPNLGPGLPLDEFQAFACYKMKCPKEEVENEVGILSDQFGDWQVRINFKSTSRRLCVPLIPPDV